MERNFFKFLGMVAFEYMYIQSSDRYISNILVFLTAIFTFRNSSNSLIIYQLLQDEYFQNAFWRLKQVTNISILFQKESMGHVGHFKFLKIFHCQLLKKCFKKAVEAFKVWASKGITATENFQNAFWRLKQVSNISTLFQKKVWDM